jgi:hypothetical protein
MVNNGKMTIASILLTKNTAGAATKEKCQTYIISLSLRGQPRSHSADIRNDVLRHSVKLRRRFRFSFVSNQVAVGSSGGRFSSVWVV